MKSGLWASSVRSIGNGGGGASIGDDARKSELKSGISGGIVSVSPGKGGLGIFSPLLDKTGNSIRGQLTARFLSQRLGMDLFASKPAF